MVKVGELEVVKRRGKRTGDGDAEGEQRRKQTVSRHGHGDMRIQRRGRGRTARSASTALLLGEKLPRQQPPQQQGWLWWPWVWLRGVEGGALTDERRRCSHLLELGAGGRSGSMVYTGVFLCCFNSAGSTSTRHRWV